MTKIETLEEAYRVAKSSGGALEPIARNSRTSRLRGERRFLRQCENTILAVSIATARAAANGHGVPRVRDWRGAEFARRYPARTSSCSTVLGRVVPTLAARKRTDAGAMTFGASATRLTRENRRRGRSLHNPRMGSVPRCGKARPERMSTTPNCPATKRTFGAY